MHWRLRYNRSTTCILALVRRMRLWPALVAVVAALLAAPAPATANYCVNCDTFLSCLLVCRWAVIGRAQCSPLIGQGRPQQAGQGGHQARLQHQHQAQAELDTIQKYHQQIQIVECFLFYRDRYVIINIIKNLNCTLQINQSIIIHQVIFLERTEPLSSLLCNNWFYQVSSRQHSGTTINRCYNYLFVCIYGTH